MAVSWELFMGYDGTISGQMIFRPHCSPEPWNHVFFSMGNHPRSWPKKYQVSELLGNLPGHIWGIYTWIPMSVCTHANSLNVQEGLRIFFNNRYNLKRAHNKCKPILGGTLNLALNLVLIHCYQKQHRCRFICIPFKYGSTSFLWGIPAAIGQWFSQQGLSSQIMVDGHPVNSDVENRWK